MVSVFFLNIENLGRVHIKVRFQIQLNTRMYKIYMSNSTHIVCKSKSTKCTANNYQPCNFVEFRDNFNNAVSKNINTHDLQLEFVI